MKRKRGKVTRKEVTRDELCLVLKSLEKRIEILRKLMCSLPKTTSYAVDPAQSEDVDKLVRLKGISNNSCSD